MPAPRIRAAGPPSSKTDLWGEDGAVMSTCMPAPRIKAAGPPSSKTDRNAAPTLAAIRGQ